MRGVSSLIAMAGVLFMILILLTSFMLYYQSGIISMELESKSSSLNLERMGERLEVYSGNNEITIYNPGPERVVIKGLLSEDSGGLDFNPLNYTLDVGESITIPYSGGRVFILTNRGRIYSPIEVSGGDGSGVVREPPGDIAIYRWGRPYVEYIYGGVAYLIYPNETYIELDVYNMDVLYYGSIEVYVDLSGWILSDGSSIYYNYTRVYNGVGLLSRDYIKPIYIGWGVSLFKSIYYSRYILITPGRSLVLNGSYVGVSGDTLYLVEGFEGVYNDGFLYRVRYWVRDGSTGLIYLLLEERASDIKLSINGSIPWRVEYESRIFNSRSIGIHITHSLALYGYLDGVPIYRRSDGGVFISRESNASSDLSKINISNPGDSYPLEWGFNGSLNGYPLDEDYTSSVSYDGDSYFNIAILVNSRFKTYQVRGIDFNSTSSIIVRLLNDVISIDIAISMDKGNPSRITSMIKISNSTRILLYRMFSKLYTTSGEADELNMAFLILFDIPARKGLISISTYYSMLDGGNSSNPYNRWSFNLLDRVFLKGWAESINISINHSISTGFDYSYVFNSRLAIYRLISSDGFITAIDNGVLELYSNTYLGGRYRELYRIKSLNDRYIAYIPIYPDRVFDIGWGISFSGYLDGDESKTYILDLITMNIYNVDYLRTLIGIEIYILTESGYAIVNPSLDPSSIAGSIYLPYRLGYLAISTRYPVRISFNLF